MGYARARRRPAHAAKASRSGRGDGPIERRAGKSGTHRSKRVGPTYDVRCNTSSTTKLAGKRRAQTPTTVRRPSKT
ncbi:MAG: hypothetical protein JNL96_10095 [Planctomycetaceae bacterium]|nr:hypothetical protein [Planctomycetaceae bacterium]